MQDPGHPSQAPTGADDQQIQDEHLQTMGRLLLGIAHELNTPLGVVASVCDSMLRCQHKLAELVAKPSLTASDHDELRGLVGHLESGRPVLQVGLDRVQALVRVLRIAGRPELMEPLEPVDLIAVLEADLLLLDHQLKQGVTVVRRFESRPTVRGHGVMLGQVFLNLLRNPIQVLDGRGLAVPGVLPLLPGHRRGHRFAVALVEEADAGGGQGGGVGRLHQEPRLAVADHLGQAAHPGGDHRLVVIPRDLHDAALGGGLVGQDHQVAGHEPAFDLLVGHVFGVQSQDVGGWRAGDAFTVGRGIAIDVPDRQDTHAVGTIVLAQPRRGVDEVHQPLVGLDEAEEQEHPRVRRQAELAAGLVAGGSGSLRSAVVVDRVRRQADRLGRGVRQQREQFLALLDKLS